VPILSWVFLGYFWLTWGTFIGQGGQEGGVAHRVMNPWSLPFKEKTAALLMDGSYAEKKPLAGREASAQNNYDSRDLVKGTAASRATREKKKPWLAGRLQHRTTLTLGIWLKARQN
jgi:hypothetical protein